ncbi:MAG: hypothetical protein ACI85N_001602 [Gammaproteobacteria bacterium]|jgi:hypothetical protein
MLKKVRSYAREKPFIRRFIGHILPSTGLFDRIFRNWKVDDAWRERINICISCPDNAYIPRCEGAGTIKNGKQLMHNGIRVNVGSYYGPEKTTLLLENKGVHEPQEEYLFQLVLDFIDSKDSSQKVMVELGSFWAFYSLWFKSRFPQAEVLMIEPEEFNIESGKRNFSTNAVEGVFVNAFVGDKHEQKKSSGVRTITVDGIKDEFELDNIDILHSDIQGYEVAMLAGAENILSNHLAEFLFISTHSNELHRDCLETITAHDYRIICDIDLDDTYSEDGLIVACNKTSTFECSGAISKRSQLS